MIISGFVGGFGMWDGKVKSRAAIDGAFGPNPPSVPVNDTPHVGQSDARAFEFARAVQALKDTKQLVHITHVEAGSVVANEEHRLLVVPRGAYFNPGPGTIPGVFEGVGKKVDDDLAKHERIALHL